MPDAARRTSLLVRSLVAALFCSATLSASPPAVANRAIAPGLPTPDTIASRSGDRNLLLLRVGVFDPAHESLDFASVGVAEARSTRFGIVQLRPGFPAAKAELEALGVELLRYLPNDAYQVRWNPASRALAAAHPAVRATLDYVAGFKVAPELWEGPGFEPGDRLTVVAFRGERLAPIAEKLLAAFPGAHRTHSMPEAPEPRLRFQVPYEDVPAFVRAAAALEEVSWIEPWIWPELHNDTSISPIQNNSTTGTPIWDQDLIGTGQIVAVSDSGLDRNQCWFTQYNNGATTNTEITDAENTIPPAVGTTWPARKVFAYWVVPGASPYDDNQVCTTSSTSFHGTHTTGTVLGDRGVVSTPTNPSFTASERDGMAPNAQILFQDLGNDSTGCLAGTAGDTSLIFEQANAAGARIHSNSWGSATGGAYGASDQEADAAAWRLEDSLIVFSAGNSGSGTNTIGSPGNAKSVVTVGALGHANSTTVASFSSRGPTDDARTKPDIMAPGSSVISAQGDDTDTGTQCPTNGQSLSGTSMACPTVAGGAALARQYFSDGFYPSGARTATDVRSPSGALLKAVLLNGTRDIASMPNNNYGWGRIWLDNNLYFSNVANHRRLRVWSLPNSAGLATGQTATYSINVPAGAELRVTLAWFDPYATLGAAVTLVNNLDLEVLGPGGTYLGNVFSAGGSVTGGTADARNTVEQVRLTAPTAGVYTITVKGTSVPGNGDAATNRQGFGLAASFGNCAGTVASAPTAPAAAPNPTAGINLSWAGAAGASSYSIYRAAGTCGGAAASDFQMVGTSSGTSFTDTRAQGGFSYAYRIRGADGCAEGPLSTCVESTATGACDLTPTFDETGVTIADGASIDCGIDLSWTAATSNCPLAPTVTYNVYRSTQYNFAPSVANRIASGVTGTSFVDTSAESLTNYFYVVKAQDSATPPNESVKVRRLKGTASSGTTVAGTFADGADSPSFLQLEDPWQITAAQASAGSLSYHNAGDTGTYLADTCASVVTPAILLTGTPAVLSYAARWNLEDQWDGVVVEISVNGGAWTDLPPTGGYPSSFAQTGAPPINACAYAASQGAFSGSSSNLFVTKTSTLSANPGDSVRIRWRFSSDPGTEEAGFFLDAVTLTNASVAQPCSQLLDDGFETGSLSRWTS